MYMNGIWVCFYTFLKRRFVGQNSPALLCDKWSEWSLKSLWYKAMWASSLDHYSNRVQELFALVDLLYVWQKMREFICHTRMCYVPNEGNDLVIRAWSFSFRYLCYNGRWDGSICSRTKKLAGDRSHKRKDHANLKKFCGLDQIGAVLDRGIIGHRNGEVTKCGACMSKVVNLVQSWCFLLLLSLLFPWKEDKLWPGQWWSVSSWP